MFYAARKGIYYDASRNAQHVNNAPTPIFRLFVCFAKKKGNKRNTDGKIDRCSSLIELFERRVIARQHSLLHVGSTMQQQSAALGANIADHDSEIDTGRYALVASRAGDIRKYNRNRNTHTYGHLQRGITLRPRDLPQKIHEWGRDDTVEVIMGRWEGAERVRRTVLFTNNLLRWRRPLRCSVAEDM